MASVDLSPVAAGLEDGQTEFVPVGNWTSTTVTKHDPNALNRQRIVQPEDALPKVRFNTTLRHEQEHRSAFARVDYFGPYSEYHADVERYCPESKVRSIGYARHDGGSV